MPQTQTTATRRPTRTPVQVGDRVGYTAKFLKSIQGDYHTSMRRATVLADCPDLGAEYVRVQWEDQDEPSVTRRDVLAKPATLAFCE